MVKSVISLKLIAKIAGRHMMEKEIKKALKDFFDKYNVPEEALDGATDAIIQILNTPAKPVYGAAIMTKSASESYDKGIKGPSAKPEMV